MFAGSKRAAVGMAVLSAGASVPVAARTSAAEPAPPGRACVTRGLSPAEVARGERSVVHCAPTRDEARAATREDLSVMADGPVSAQAAFITAGFFYRSDLLDDVPLEVVGADCGVQVRALQPPWRDDISGGRLAVCSLTKMFQGDQLDGASTKYPRDPRNPYAKFGLQDPFNNRIHSISFGA